MIFICNHLKITNCTIANHENICWSVNLYNDTTSRCSISTHRTNNRMYIEALELKYMRLEKKRERENRIELREEVYVYARDSNVSICVFFLFCFWFSELLLRCYLRLVDLINIMPLCFVFVFFLLLLLFGILHIFTIKVSSTRTENPYIGRIDCPHSRCCA